MTKNVCDDEGDRPDVLYRCSTGAEIDFCLEVCTLLPAMLAGTEQRTAQPVLSQGQNIAVHVADYLLLHG